MARIESARIYAHLDGYLEMKADLQRIRKEMEFSQTALKAGNIMQEYQRTYAPIGKTGKGPHGRIPRRIRPGRVRRYSAGDTYNIASFTSRTTYGPAIFTNEGTGTHRRKNPGKYKWYKRGAQWVYHPGVRRQGWWDHANEDAKVPMLRIFHQKVSRVLRVRRDLG